VSLFFPQRSGVLWQQEAQMVPGTLVLIAQFRICFDGEASQQALR